MKFVDTPEAKRKNKESNFRQKLMVSCYCAATFISISSFGAILYDFLSARGIPRHEIVSVMFGITIFGFVFGVIGLMLESTNVGGKDADK